MNNGMMNMDSKKVVILLAHPDIKESRVNKLLIETVKEIDGVQVFDLYGMEQPFSAEDWIRIIANASAVVYQFPLFWLSAPYLLKKWQDEIFSVLARTPAVAGKPLQVVTTVGAGADTYRSGGKNYFTIDELLRPYQVSAIRAGMVWQTPLVVYGAASDRVAKNVAEVAAAYRQKIAAMQGSAKMGNTW